jgi:hypothetical protein
VVSSIGSTLLKQIGGRCTAGECQGGNKFGTGELNLHWDKFIISGDDENL